MTSAPPLLKTPSAKGLKELPPIPIHVPWYAIPIINTIILEGSRETREIHSESKAQKSVNTLVEILLRSYFDELT